MKNFILISGFLILTNLLFAQERWEKVMFPTADAVDIFGMFAYPKNNTGSVPAVIFIHQVGSTKEEWTRSRLFRKVVNAGFAALAYDIRGHGESGGEIKFPDIFNNPDKAPQDLKAALNFLSRKSFVNPNRIAVVGASIGANLACVAIGIPELKVKTAVAISGNTAAVFNLAGTRNINLKSVYYIASENDQDGKRTEWAEELFKQTETPRKLEIIKNSDAHGVSIFEDEPKLHERIFDWLREHL